MNKPNTSAMDSRPRRLRPVFARGWLRVTIPALVLGIPGVAGIGEAQPPSETAQQEEDLAGRLIRKARTGADEDVMAGIIRLMDDAARKLEFGFDPGEETQALQKRVMDRLEDAIKQAASQRRARSQGRQASAGDKRRRPENTKPKPGEEGRDADSDSAAAGAAAPVPVSAGGDPLNGKLLESRRSWGHLPQREREEVIQGMGEEHLERYREWIERYYRALQAADE